MTQNGQTIKHLKKWLRNNSGAYLAWKLGYKTTSVIENWLKRGSIPHWMEPHVWEIISLGDIKE